MRRASCSPSAARPRSTAGSRWHERGVLRTATACGCSARRSRRSATPRTASSSCERLAEIGVKTARSSACRHARARPRQAAREIGFPVMLRGGFALGGKGSGIVETEARPRAGAQRAFAGGHRQVLVEECLRGWKEIEYEVVRDGRDNCITVCNMENFDPMGIHTGESIVVAPIADAERRGVPAAPHARDRRSSATSASSASATSSTRSTRRAPTTASSRSTRASRARARSPARPPATRSPTSPPRSRSATRCPRSRTASPDARRPSSSRRSTTSSARCRAGTSASSAARPRASAAR